MRKSFFSFVAKAANNSVPVGVLVVLLSISSIGIPSRTESQTTAEETSQIKRDVQRGIKHANRNELKEARDSFDGVLAKHPKNATAYNNLANLDLLAGKYASAMQNYWKALQSDKTDTNIHLNLGILYYLQMSITQKYAYVGDKKSKATWEDWKFHSEEAFDKAFKNIKSVKEACLHLGMPYKETPDFSWVQKQLCESAKRANRPSSIKPGGGRARSEWKVPVYWRYE